MTERNPSLQSKPLVGKRITLCVTGSVAAYKAVLLARLLVQAGADVQAVMTRSATRFVGPATLSGLTGRPVLTDMFAGAGEPHVELARDSDLIVVVPATADVLARLAGGRANDLVTAIAMCARCSVVVAPAMHPTMWSHSITQSNAQRLASLPGWRLIGPVEGEVASGDHGMGRLAEPEQLFDAVRDALPPSSPRGEESPALRGRHVVVTAGPTAEDLDPVRSLTNRSSGKMGFAIARSAARRGARVTLIAGPVALDTPEGVSRLNVRSALEMQAALGSVLGARLDAADALVMCAAVADYRPLSREQEKIKRKSGELLLRLVPNPDLLAEIGRSRVASRPLLIGFAVESASGAELVNLARGKLTSKRADAIVANTDREAIGTDDTRAVLVTSDAERALGPAPKSVVGEAIVDFIVERLK